MVAKFTENGIEFGQFWESWCHSGQPCGTPAAWRDSWHCVWHSGSKQVLCHCDNTPNCTRRSALPTRRSLSLWNVSHSVFYCTCSTKANLSISLSIQTQKAPQVVLSLIPRPKLKQIVASLTVTILINATNKLRKTDTEAFYFTALSPKHYFTEALIESGTDYSGIFDYGRNDLTPIQAGKLNQF